MKELISRWKDSKVWSFILKYHLLYLAIPFCFWGVKALLYNIVIWINPPTRVLHFSIDDSIPFIKYFFVFYCTYYFLPQFALWGLSFYDKKKYWTILGALGINMLVGFIFYLSFNVTMIRQPGYPNGVKLTDVKDVSSFFDFCINWIYSIDPKAMNCFPSLHAVVGMLLAIIGIYIPKIDDKQPPLALRIICIIFGIGCVLSTIFIKQHYFIDMIVGVILAIISYITAYLIIWKVRKTKSCNEDIEVV
ncbi:MAG: phosphatase PAP2 family protein [Anaeroplasmataceae bacterium]|nr:phosphatase PAP2 family protein [Anaeroplasmataceae bacterium]